MDASAPSSPAMRTNPTEALPNSARLNETLSFVAGNQTGHISAQDSDVFSWLLMNSDLFPNPHPRRLRGDSETSRFPTRLRGDSESNLPPPLVTSMKEAALPGTLGNRALTTVSMEKDLDLRTNREAVVSGDYGSYDWDRGDETEDHGEQGRVEASGDNESARTSSSDSANSSDTSGTQALVRASRRTSDSKLGGGKTRSVKAGKGGKGKGKGGKKAASSASESKALSKREARLEKNREIARNCRKRKREKLVMMEEELTRLRAENEELRRKLDIGSHNSDRRELVRRAKMMELERMLQQGSGASEEKIGAALKDYKECFADNGRERELGLRSHE